MRNKLSFFIASIIAFVCLSSSNANAATITSAATGSWGSSGTWSGGLVPGCSDTAVVANGHTVSLTADIGGLSCNLNITINSGGVLDLAGNEINFSGNNTTFTNNGTFTNSGLTLKRLFTANGGANFNFAGNGIYSGKLQLHNVSATWHIAANTSFTFSTAVDNTFFLIDHPAGLDLSNDLVLIGPTSGVGYAVFDKQSGASVTGTGSLKTQGNVRLKFVNMDRPVETVSGAAQGEGLFRSGWTVDSGASLTLSALLNVNNQSGGSVGMLIQSGATLNLAGNQLNISVNAPFTNNGMVNNTGAFAVVQFMDNGTHTISGTGNYSINAGLHVLDNVTTIAAGSSLVFLGPPLRPSPDSVAVSPANILVGTATLIFNGPGHIKLSRGVQNNGIIRFNQGGATCGAGNVITLRSSSPGTQRPWDGAGTYSMTNVDVKDQGGTSAINVTGGFSTGNNASNWVFSSQCPTAASVTVSGRVLADLDGRGVTNARVTMTDQEGRTRTVFTGRTGRFTFENVETGRVYVISVGSRRFTYVPRVINVLDNMNDVDFVPEQ